MGEEKKKRYSSEFLSKELEYHKFLSFLLAKVHMNMCAYNSKEEYINIPHFLCLFYVRNGGSVMVNDYYPGQPDFREDLEKIPPIHRSLFASYITSHANEFFHWGGEIERYLDVNVMQCSRLKKMLIKECKDITNSIKGNFPISFVDIKSLFHNIKKVIKDLPFYLKKKKEE